MPLGSSSAAPVTRPGPRLFRNPDDFGMMFGFGCIQFAALVCRSIGAGQCPARDDIHAFYHRAHGPRDNRLAGA